MTEPRVRKFIEGRAKTLQRGDLADEIKLLLAFGDAFAER